jgi:serine/tyrosine/threonine adenylyltransferase
LASTMAADTLQSFSTRYHAAWTSGMHAKLGLEDQDHNASELIDALLAMLHAQGVDYTSFFRKLSVAVLGDNRAVQSLFTDRATYDEWAARWHAEVSRRSPDLRAVARAMDRVNPLYIPRNHKVEEALGAATNGELEPFRRLLEVITRPFDERDGFESYASPGPATSAPYRTFCGT